MVQENYEELVAKIPKDKILGRENVRGNDYIRTDWRTLVFTYPSSWIIYANDEDVDDNRLFLCTVLAICKDDYINTLRLNLMRKGYVIGAMRTSNGITGELSL